MKDVTGYLSSLPRCGRNGKKSRNESDHEGAAAPIQSLFEVYIDGESRFVLPETACPFCTAVTLQKRNACFSSAEEYLDWKISSEKGSAKAKGTLGDRGHGTGWTKQSILVAAEPGPVLIALQLPWGSRSLPAPWVLRCRVFFFFFDRVRQESPAEMSSRAKQVTSDLKLPDGWENGRGIGNLYKHLSN